MALRSLFLLLMVCSCTMGVFAAFYSPQRTCLQSIPGIKCQCGKQVICSCLPVKTLDLRNLSQEYVVTQASVFQLKSCRSTSVLVFPGAFNHLIFLEHIIFHNVGRLTFEHNSINFESLIDNAVTLTFSSITNLSIRKNAINIQAKSECKDCSVSVKIEHSTLVSLMKSAIVAKLQELTMEEMVVKARPWPGAIVCQGSAGASVTMRSLTIKKGLSGRWITGNVSRLSIIRSNLRLLPDAFAGVNMVGNPKSQAGIILSGNNFMVPFLPSHALPSDGTLLLAQKNHIVCQCQNLVWLLEPPNSLLKKGVKDSLICRNKFFDTLLASCKTPYLYTV